MAKDEQDKPTPERRPGGGATPVLLALCLAAIVGATGYIAWRLDALDEHINNARIAAEEAERAAGEAAQNSANPRQRAPAEAQQSSEAQPPATPSPSP